MIYLINLIICIIYFAYRVEKKDMKGILYRKNSDNILCFTPYNFINLIFIPLYNYRYWNLQLLDINFIFIFITSYLFTTFIIFSLETT
jgi:hypothetical protein